MQSAAPHANEPRKLLVVGTMRSGTTLLNRLLRAHPQIGMVYHPTRFFEYAMGQPLGEFVESFKTRYAGYGSVPADWPRGVFDLESLAARTVEPSMYGRVLQSLLNKDGCTVIGEKYAGRGEEMAPFQQAEPSGKILMIVRDPRDAFVSNRMRIEQEATIDLIARGAHLKLLDDWAYLSVQHRNFNQAQRGQYLQIRYEDLVASPEETSRRICAFLAVPFAPEMIAAGNLKHDDGREWLSNTSHGNQSAEINDESVGKYRNLISPGDLLLINCLLEDQMRFFGYVPDEPQVDTAHIVDACRSFRALSGTLSAFKVFRPVLADTDQPLDVQLETFLRKVVRYCGLGAADFFRGFAVSATLTPAAPAPAPQPAPQVNVDMGPVALELGRLVALAEKLAATPPPQVHVDMSGVAAEIGRLASVLESVTAAVAAPASNVASELTALRKELEQASLSRVFRRLSGAPKQGDA